MNKSTIIGWLFGIIIFFSFNAMIPAPTCNDGWQSSSIGQRGACSWHHGVNRHFGLRLLVIFAAILGGVLITRIHNGKFLEDIEEYIENHKRKKNGLADYTSYFNGYKQNTPKEVIIQLMMLSDEPESLVKTACDKFKLTEAEASNLAREAVARKQASNK